MEISSAKFLVGYNIQGNSKLLKAGENIVQILTASGSKLFVYITIVAIGSIRLILINMHINHKTIIEIKTDLSQMKTD